MPRIEPVEPGPPGPGHDPLDLHGVLGRRGHAHVPGVGEGDQGGEQARVREGRREEQQRRGERRGHIALEGRFEPRREGEIVGFGRRRRLRRLRLRRREPQRRLLEPSGEVELAPGLEVCEEGPLRKDPVFQRQSRPRPRIGIGIRRPRSFLASSSDDDDPHAAVEPDPGAHPLGEPADPRGTAQKKRSAAPGERRVVVRVPAEVVFVPAPRVGDREEEVDRGARIRRRTARGFHRRGISRDPLLLLLLHLLAKDAGAVGPGRGGRREEGQEGRGERRGRGGVVGRGGGRGEREVVVMTVTKKKTDRVGSFSFSCFSFSVVVVVVLAGGAKAALARGRPARRSGGHSESGWKRTRR